MNGEMKAIFDPWYVVYNSNGTYPGSQMDESYLLKKTNNNKNMSLEKI